MDLIPINNSDYGGRSLILFRCIHALMSHQLRDLIARTIKHLLNIFNCYKNGNEFLQYEIHNPKLQQQPLITLSVTVVGAYFDHKVIKDWKIEDDLRNELYLDRKEDNITPFESNEQSAGDFNATNKNPSRIYIQSILKDWHKFYIFPLLHEIPEYFVEIFKMILRIGYKIPCLEYVMTKGTF